MNSESLNTNSHQQTPVRDTLSEENNNTVDFSPEVIEEKNIRISLVPSKRKRTRKMNILIEGGFNVATAKVVEETCHKLTQHFDHLSITLKNIEDIDLAAVQLLRVLKTSAIFLQKTITIDSELSAADRSLLACSGLMELVSKQQ